MWQNKLTITLQSLALWVCAALLSGCQSEPAKALFDDYAERVANALDQPLAPLAQTTTPALPQRRERLLALPELREGLLDLLELRHCQLLPLIAERNSSLGKFWPASKQLHYEFRFYQQLQLCIQHPESQQAELQQRLASYAEHKRALLPRLLNNALYASEEIEASFAASLAPLAPNSDAQTTLNAVNQLTGLVASLPTEDSWQPPALEPLAGQFEILYSNPLGTPVIKALLLASAQLDRVSSTIEQRLDRRAVCFKGHRSQRADIVFAVFQRYYARGVQPYLAQLDKTSQQWNQSHWQAIRKLPATGAMRQFANQVFAQQTDSSLWRVYRQALKRHTQAWRRLLTQCNLLPTKPLSN